MNTWYPATIKGNKVVIKFNIVTTTINTIEIMVSVPCRKGQYVILNSDKYDFGFKYYNGKCIISWRQNTSSINCLGDLLEDIQEWFKYCYAVRMDADIFTSVELLKVL